MTRLLLIAILALLASCSMPWDAQTEQIRIQERERTERAQLSAREADARAREAMAYTEGERAKAEAAQALAQAEGYKTLAEKIRSDSQSELIEAWFKTWAWYLGAGFVAFALVLGAFVAMTAVRVRTRVVYLLPGEKFPELPAGEKQDRLFLPEIVRREHSERQG